MSLKFCRFLPSKGDRDQRWGRGLFRQEEYKRWFSEFGLWFPFALDLGFGVNEKCRLVNLHLVYSNKGDRDLLGDFTTINSLFFLCTGFSVSLTLLSFFFYNQFKIFHFSLTWSPLVFVSFGFGLTCSTSSPSVFFVRFDGTFWGFSESLTSLVYGKFVFRTKSRLLSPL